MKKNSASCRILGLALAPIVAIALLAAAGLVETPSMKVVRPEKVRFADVLIAAPHDGYDLHTGAIAKKIGAELKVPVLIATDYREPAAGRFHNVNRPTRSTLDAQGDPGPEVSDPESKAVFDAWVSNMRELHALPMPIYAEIHGNSRKVTIEGERTALDVIEVATVGLSKDTLEVLRTHWNERRAKDPELLPIYFDVCDASYEFRKVKQGFYFRATTTKECGVLQSKFVSRALHFELPESARTSTARCRAVEAAIADLVAKLAAN